MCGRYLLEEEAIADMWMILKEMAEKHSASQSPLSTSQPPLSTSQPPLSTSQPPLSMSQTPLSMSQPPLSMSQPTLSMSRQQLSTLAKGEVFPTDIVPVYTPDGAAVVKWGFPKWKGAGVIINARAETALEKSMFRKPLLQRRCLIPSSGFYEWDHAATNTRAKKDKYLLRLPGERVLFMAGMINQFRETSGNEYSAFVILTTAANESVATIHDRMPVILAPDERGRWLSDNAFMEQTLKRVGPVLERVLC